MVKTSLKLSAAQSRITIIFLNSREKNQAINKYLFFAKN